MWGFNDPKDLLEVIIIPIVIFGLGALLPYWFERRRRQSFISLIKRELDEMTPSPKQKKKGEQWHQHLKKRFVHEAIFQNPSDNRDFILSLPPDLAYNEAQLWIHYEKAANSQDPQALAEHGASWCDYLRAVCQFLDGRQRGSFYQRIYKPWEDLIIAYHPDLETTGRLNPPKEKVAS